MLVELVVAVSLPLWLCVEELARIRAQGAGHAPATKAAVQEPRRQGALPAKAGGAARASAGGRSASWA